VDALQDLSGLASPAAVRVAAHWLLEPPLIWLNATGGQELSGL
jgi:hypothetical protein